MLDYRPAVTWFAGSASVFDLTLEFVQRACFNSFTAQVGAVGGVLISVGSLPIYFQGNA